VTSDPLLLRPLAAPGTVAINPRERTLTVRPAPDARAYAKVLWNEGVRAQAEAPGYGGPPTVWASGGGGSEIAHGVPTARGDALVFHFHPGHPQYQKLVSTPGLRATFVVDRGSSQILGVRFHGR
jgi:hypothetical protein